MRKELTEEATLSGIQVGVPICTAPSPQLVDNVVSDGSGGAIIFWRDFRDAEFGGEPPTWLNNAIYAQRVDSIGSTQWEENGIVIRPILGVGVFTLTSSAVSDDSGGAIFAWGDKQFGGRDIIAQRVTGAGELLWGEDGIIVNGSWNLRNGIPYMVKDGVGGAIIKYFPDINLSIGRLQRVDGDGNLLWAEDGVSSILGTIISDDSSGVIVGWAEQLQRYGSDGQKLWGDDGIILNESAADIIFSIIAPDGIGGVFIMWMYDQTRDFMLFTQRIDNSGNLLWQEGGVQGGGAPMISDMEGGIIYPFSVIDSLSYRAYFGRINDSGIPLWGEQGILFWERFEFVPGSSLSRLVSDGNSGIIIVWEEQNTNSRSWDVLAQQVSRNGNLGEIITVVEDRNFSPLARGFQLYNPYPNPFNARTIIDYELPHKGDVKIRIFNLEGKVVWASQEGVKASGKYSFTWDGVDRIGHPVSSGIYFVTLILKDGQSKTMKMLLIK